MKFELCYPDWKEKAVTFSYDDGQIYDRRLVSIFDRYRLKATFHLNSGTLDEEGYVTSSELKELYKNHEVACHGVHHEYPTHLTREMLIGEFWEDRLFLEEKCSRIIKGCSYAFGEYNQSVVETLKTLGFIYCRTVESTRNFRVPEDFMRWTPSCHHNDAFDGMAERFLTTPEYMKLPLLYVWGHSFEFEWEQTWDKMEEFCQQISGKKDVWYATNMEYVNYMTAARQLMFRADRSQVENLSKIPVYVKLDGERRIL